MNEKQRAALESCILAFPKTAAIEKDTGKRLKDFSDQQLLGAALTGAVVRGLSAEETVEIFRTKFGVGLEDMRRATAPIIRHLTRNN
jgi:hypothetical protein